MPLLCASVSVPSVISENCEIPTCLTNLWADDYYFTVRRSRVAKGTRVGGEHSDDDGFRDVMERDVTMHSTALRTSSSELKGSACNLKGVMCGVRGAVRCIR